MSGQQGLTKNDLQKLSNILDSLISKPESDAFREPVDYKYLNLHDYPQIVKKPMDLGTIKENLNNFDYKTVKQCLDDIQLVWDNCKLYNLEESDIYKVSVMLENDTKELVNAAFGHIDYGKNNPSYLKLKDRNNQQIDYALKDQFTSDVQELDPTQLGKVIEIIRQGSPSAFKELDQERHQILVDNINQGTYNEIQGYLDRQRKKKKLKSKQFLQ